MLGRAGLVNTMGALVLPFGVSALGTFLVRQALFSIPDELIEAARLDGAGELHIVYRLLAPMLTPTLGGAFPPELRLSLNDYFWPLIMTTDEHSDRAGRHRALREQGTGVRWHLVMAGNVILSAPTLVVFAIAQRHLVRAVTARGF